MPGRRDSADERLRTYRAKRDFSITAEPAGTDPAGRRRLALRRPAPPGQPPALRPPPGGRRGPRQLGRPQGPDARPGGPAPRGARRGPPARLLRLRGGDRRRRVRRRRRRSCGTGARGRSPRATTRSAEIAAGDLHLALARRQAARPVRPRRGAGPDGREQWLLIKKRDDDAVAGWDPEAHPRSVKSGRTNDEVRDAPAASWSGQASWAGPTADELAALDDLGRAGTLEPGRPRRCTSRTWTRCCSRGAAGGRPITKRDLVRHHAVMAPVVLPYLADRPVEVHRCPGAGRRRVPGMRRCPPARPDWVRRWRDPDAAARRGPASTSCPTRPPRSPTSPNWARSSCTRGLATIDAPHDADLGRCSTSSPARPTALRPRSSSPACTAPRSTTSASRGDPCSPARRAIQIWVPVARGATFDRTRQWVDTVSRAIGATVPDLVGWEGAGSAAAAGSASTTPRTPPTSGWSPRSAPAWRPAHRSSVPIAWDELDDDRLRPDHWTIRDVGERVRASATRWRRSSAPSSACRRSDRSSSTAGVDRSRCRCRHRPARRWRPCRARPGPSPSSGTSTAPSCTPAGAGARCFRDALAELGHDVAHRAAGLRRAHRPRHRRRPARGRATRSGWRPTPRRRSGCCSASRTCTRAREAEYAARTQALPERAGGRAAAGDDRRRADGRHRQRGVDRPPQARCRRADRRACDLDLGAYGDDHDDRHHLVQPRPSSASPRAGHDVRAGALLDRRRHAPRPRRGPRRRRALRARGHGHVRRSTSSPPSTPTSCSPTSPASTLLRWRRCG